MEKIKETTPITQETEDAIRKSVASLTDELFKGYTEGKSALDIYGDAPKTADEALARVEKSPNDASRGAGRPKEISSVPENDEDGARAGEYDKKITSNKDKEDENKENKEQLTSMDQTNDNHRITGKPKAPAMRPFIKGETMDTDLEKSFARFQEFQKFEDLQKSTATPEATPQMVTMTVAEYEDLKKSQTTEAPKEPLIKATEKVETEETEFLRKGLATLTGQIEANGALLAKIAKQPILKKSITGIDAIEKSNSPVEASGQAGLEHLTKASAADAMDALVKSGQLKPESAIEFDTSGTIFDPQERAIVDAYLSQRQ